jgi:hypothetical protein
LLSDGPTTPRPGGTAAQAQRCRSMSQQSPPSDPATRVRQGQTLGVVRWVLGVSLVLAIIAMVVACLVA